jgi:site-specific DNA-methyltransferase (cytosine-N4-specific)
MIRHGIHKQNPLPRLLNHDWSFPDEGGGNDLFSLHPYPAKFIPKIPRTLIEDLGVPKNTSVFDPFCGCGTTLIVAQSLGLPSVGVDLNPIACLISRVATRPCPTNLLSVAIKCICKAKGYKIEPSIPPIPNLDHWFKKSVQHGIASLLLAIDGIKDENLRDALRLALSSTVVRVSNQDSDTRYAAIEKKTSTGDVYTLFERACQRYQQIIPSNSVTLAPATVINKNIFDVIPDDLPARIGLVICSPPYPNAYEYWLYHK